MAAAAILNIAKSGMLDYSESGMVNVCQPTKFEANIFINDRDIAKHRKSEMAASAILNFGKSGILSYNNPDMVSLYQPTEFEENTIPSLTTEI